MNLLEQGICGYPKRSAGKDRAGAVGEGCPQDHREAREPLGLQLPKEYFFSQGVYSFDKLGLS